MARSFVSGARSPWTLATGLLGGAFSGPDTGLCFLYEFRGRRTASFGPEHYCLCVGVAGLRKLGKESTALADLAAAAWGHHQFYFYF
jgi:hypothetical protein